jgi:hypothetical protein
MGRLVRIRSIKPEFWKSDDIDAMSWDDRLVFIGLWSYVDDNGVGIDKLSAITSDLFANDLARDPTETLSRVSSALNRFSKSGHITRYSVDGKNYLHVTTWDEHQRVNNPNKERYPLPTCGNVESQQALVTPDGEPISDLPPGAGEQGNRGTEEQGSKTRASQTASEPDRFNEFWMAYPRKDDKAKAQTAYEAARKKTPQAEIIAGAQRYAADPNRDDAYTKLPASWLHAGSWANGPLPLRNGSPKPNAAAQRNADSFATLRRMQEHESQSNHRAI